VEAYWGLSAAPPALVRSPATCINQTEKLLLEAVRTRMTADAPVGAFLSGGLDSSLIVALMAAVGDARTIQTFTASFAGNPSNEDTQAAATAAHLGVRNRSIMVQPSWYLRDWQQLSWQRDAPLSEPADVAVFHTARIASESVKAVLSGEGADELFYGYPKYRMGRLIGLFGGGNSSFPSSLAKGLEQTLGKSNPRLRVMLRALGEPDELERMRGWFAPFTALERRRLLGNDALLKMPSGAAMGAKLAERMSRLDCGSWLADNLLERGDRMCMAASVEMRTPYLDHRVVEHALGLPDTLHTRRWQNKWLLKRVATKYLPRATVQRKKHGFRVPLEEWFRRHWSETLQERLLDSQSFVGAQLDASQIRALVERHLRGESDEGIRLWTLLSLEIWYQGFQEAWRELRYPWTHSPKALVRNSE